MSESPDNPLDKQLPDGELDEYLQGDSSVSRQYRQLHSAEVPAELDRVVLRQAHDAVKVAPAKSRTWTRWSGPLALAASAVLVVSIVVETGMQDEVTLTAEKATAPAAPQMEPQVEAKRQSRAEESEAVENDAADSGASEAPRLPQSAPAEPAAVARDRAVPQDSARSPVYVTTPEPSPPEAMIMESASPAEQAEEALPQVARERRNAEAPPPVAAPSSAPRSEANAQKAAADTQEIIVTGNAAASRAISAPMAQYADPERWLQDIRQLRKDNKQEQADREWRRFREAFPDHPVSETDAAREVVR